MSSIVNALNNALNLILTFIPRIIGFVIILVIGLILAAVVSRALTAILRKVGFDRVANRIGLSRFEQRMGVSMDPAGTLGRIVYWFILLIFLVPAADALGLPAVSAIINQLVDYIPNVFVAILVLFLGTLAATFVADLVRGATATARIGNPGIFAGVARWSIIVFAALIALNQLQIAPALINELFGGIVIAAAIAIGLAFGLGGQETARRLLNRGESTMSVAASQISAAQANGQLQGANNAQADAERARVAQMQAEQARVAQMQAEQARVAQMQAEQARIAQMQTEQTRPQQNIPPYTGPAQ